MLVSASIEEGTFPFLENSLLDLAGGKILIHTRKDILRDPLPRKQPDDGLCRATVSLDTYSFGSREGGHVLRVAIPAEKFFLPLDERRFILFVHREDAAPEQQWVYLTDISAALVLPTALAVVHYIGENILVVKFSTEEEMQRHRDFLAKEGEQEHMLSLAWANVHEQEMCEDLKVSIYQIQKF